MDNSEFQKHTQRVDELVQRLTALPESDARTTSLELLQSLMDLHGAAMSRIVELLSESGDAGHKALSKLGADPMVCGLLVLYGIHPVSIEERVKAAIQKLNSQLAKRRSSVTLSDVTETVVRVAVLSQPHGHGSPDQKLKPTIEQAILEAAPEVAEIIIEGLSSPDFILLNMIQPAKEDTTYEESAA